MHARFPSIYICPRHSEVLRLLADRYGAHDTQQHRDYGFKLALRGGVSAGDRGHRADVPKQYYPACLLLPLLTT